jgi:hypothetical protein
MRSTADLIIELRQQSKGCVVTLLIVAFDDMYENVSAELSDDDALAKLNKLVLDGGSTIGLLWGRMEGGLFVMEYRLLEENMDHAGAALIMEEVASHTRKHFGVE